MKKLIVIAGPTSVGKTKFAIELANSLSCPIVSADSRQVYKELNIGVARPSPAELSQATHYFIASHSIHQALNAGQYEKEVIPLLDEIFTTHKVAILCGGTGLYIKAVCEGLDNLPKSDPQLRQELHALFEEKGIEALQEKLKTLDPAYYKQAEIHNPQRIIRAIEIATSTGKSNLEVKNLKQTKRNFTTYNFCLDMDREELYNRINNKVETMLKDGFEQEAKSLHPFAHLEPLKTVGYREFFDYFEGKISRDRCIELIKQNTRRYAKRQVTWFKNQGGFEFVKPNEIEKVLGRIW